MVDQIRFFATAARHLEGKSAGEYMAGHDVVRPPRAGRRLRPGRAVELPDDDGGLEVRPGDRRRQRRRAQAERHDAGQRRRCSPRSPPSSCRRACSTSICGDRDTGRAMVDHDDAGDGVDHRLGARRHGGRRRRRRTSLKRVHLELGGKAPVVVFDDADIEAAVEGISIAGYFNAGQDCTAATRVLAGPGIYGDFADALAEAAKGTKTGLPDDEDVLYGPVNNPNQLARVSGFLDRAPDHARVLDRRRPPGRRPATSTSRPSSPTCARTTR